MQPVRENYGSELTSWGNGKWERGEKTVGERERERERDEGERRRKNKFSGIEREGSGRGGGRRIENLAGS